MLCTQIYFDNLFVTRNIFNSNKQSAFKTDFNSNISYEIDSNIINHFPMGLSFQWISSPNLIVGTDTSTNNDLDSHDGDFSISNSIEGYQDFSNNVLKIDPSSYFEKAKDIQSPIPFFQQLDINLIPDCPIQRQILIERFRNFCTSNIKCMETNMSHYLLNFWNEFQDMPSVEEMPSVSIFNTVSPSYGLDNYDYNIDEKIIHPDVNLSEVQISNGNKNQNVNVGQITQNKGKPFNKSSSNSNNINGNIISNTIQSGSSNIFTNHVSSNKNIRKTTSQSNRISKPIARESDEEDSQINPDISPLSIIEIDEDTESICDANGKKIRFKVVRMTNDYPNTLLSEWVPIK